MAMFRVDSNITCHSLFTYLVNALPTKTWTVVVMGLFMCINTEVYMHHHQQPAKLRPPWKLSCDCSYRAVKNKGLVHSAQV